MGETLVGAYTTHGEGELFTMYVKYWRTVLVEVIRKDPRGYMGPRPRDLCDGVASFPNMDLLRSFLRPATSGMGYWQAVLERTGFGYNAANLDQLKEECSTRLQLNADEILWHFENDIAPALCVRILLDEFHRRGREKGYDDRVSTSPLVNDTLVLMSISAHCGPY